MGVLVRFSDFWYPGRALQLEKAERTGSENMWRIRMWRLCDYSNTEDSPQSLDVLVPESRIVDELWRDTVERRKIRVSFTHVK